MVVTFRLRVHVQKAASGQGRATCQWAWAARNPVSFKLLRLPAKFEGGA